MSEGWAPGVKTNKQKHICSFTVILSLHIHNGRRKIKYLFYNKPGSLSLLLSHLLHLNSLCEFLSKGQVCLKEHNAIITAVQNPPQKNQKLCFFFFIVSYQWNVVQDEAERGGSFCKVLADLSGHKLSLGDELPSIKPSLEETWSYQLTWSVLDYFIYIINTHHYCL